MCERISISSQAVSAVQEAPSTSEFIQERMDFLKEDLTHLFDDQGIDQSQYDDVVEFRDPITSYNDAKGYMFNIAMLKRVFAPTFQLHDIKQTGEYEVTTRWTMTMQFTLTRGTPISRFWDPKLVFTGTSVMGINPSNGKFNRHLDYWDAIENQKYFSWEAFGHVLQQMADVSRIPKDLPTPYYIILKKFKEFEIRRYDSMLVAEADMDSRSKEASTSGSRASSSKSSPAGKGDGAFNTLAKYIFGGNAAGARMSMTTPVFSDNRGAMQFVIEPGYRDVASVPAPQTESVKVKERGERLYAVASFSGVATPEAASEQESGLRDAMRRRGIVADGSDWLLASLVHPCTAADVASGTRERFNGAVKRLPEMQAPMAPSMAPSLSPSPAVNGVSTEVLIAVAVASFALVGLLIGVVRFLFVHAMGFEARAADSAAAAVVEEEAASMRRKLQRVTPVIIIQPNQEILYGRKERPHTDEDSAEVHICIDSGAPNQQPSNATPNPLKSARSSKRFYVVEIPELSELPCSGVSQAEEEVLKGIQLAREFVRSNVCRDSVSSCQA
ncbi:g5552 [Coccomyxa elongata]